MAHFGAPVPGPEQGLLRLLRTYFEVTLIVCHVMIVNDIDSNEVREDCLSVTKINCQLNV